VIIKIIVEYLDEYFMFRYAVIIYYLIGCYYYVNIYFVDYLIC